MISGDDEQRVLPLACSLQAFHQLAELMVIVRHALVVEAAGGIHVCQTADPSLLIGLCAMPAGVDWASQTGCCRQLLLPLIEALAHLGFSEEDASRVIPIGARGCESCRDTGYRGRTGLFEVMEMTEPLREMIIGRASAREIRQQATEDGMLSLRQSGLQKIAAGLSTVEEVTRETSR